VAILYSLVIMLAAATILLGRNQSLYDFWFYLTNFSRYPAEIYAGPWGGPLRTLFTFVIPILLVINVPARTLARPLTGAAMDAVGEPGLGWTISPAQLVYPHAPQHVHGTEQGGWLILLEPAANPPLLSPAQRPAADCAQTALQGDAARLLDNMLRALGLQEKPRVFSAALHRAPPDADLSHAQALQPALETLLRELRPDCVLVLGLASARAVLGRHDALGRLRAEPHHIAGVPTVVTYDPNYLLRAPQAKAGAWADLVQADAFTKGL
jgi:DNA polymerase